MTKTPMEQNIQLKNRQDLPNLEVTAKKEKFQKGSGILKIYIFCKAELSQTL